MKKYIMKNKLPTLAAAAGLIASGGTASAATTFTAAKGLQSNGYERWASTASVGKYGGGNFATTGYAIFSTQAIAAEYPGVDFSTATFDLNFDTVTVNQGSSPDLTAGTFVVGYLGFYENVASLATNDFWNGGSPKLLGKASLQNFDTGVTDTAGAGQNLLATGFNLTDVTESDSANDYVAFRFSYSTALSQSSNTVQELGNFTLSTADGVPEPSSALLGGIGLLALLRRRRA